MNNVDARACLVAGWLFLGVAFGAPLTPLVDVQGREIEVEVLSLEDGQVKILLKGREMTVPLERLDEASQGRVEEALEAREKERVARIADRMKLPDGRDIVPGKLLTFVLEGTDEDRGRSNCEALKSITVNVAFPEGFDPDKTWPVFFSNDTGGGRNAGVARTYQRAANSLGYVVIGAQGEALPGAEKKAAEALSYWDARGRVTRRAIDELAKRWPRIMESDWSYGGFSGGAKNCCFLAVYLYETYKDTTERAPVGFYMGGCNEMKMSHAIEAYRSRKQPFKDAAFFVSNGDQDKVATPAQGEMVEDLLKKDGFRSTKREVYAGGHSFYEPHFITALEWFKEHAAAAK